MILLVLSIQKFNEILFFCGQLSREGQGEKWEMKNEKYFTICETLQPFNRRCHILPRREETATGIEVLKCS